MRSVSRQIDAVGVGRALAQLVVRRRHLVGPQVDVGSRAPAVSIASPGSRRVTKTRGAVGAGAVSCVDAYRLGAAAAARLAAAARAARAAASIAESCASALRVSDATRAGSWFFTRYLNSQYMNSRSSLSEMCAVCGRFASSRNARSSSARGRP